MRRAAVYARYSSDLQSPSSIDDQFALCRAHAERLGAEVVATYGDADAHGSSTVHRPGYRQLLAAALTTPRPFDLILVEDLSRLTRQMNETMSLYHRLRLHGVELVGVSDGIASAQRGGKIQMAVKGLMNEMYLDDLGDKTHRGLSGSLARGRSTGGKIFGYRSVSLPTDVRTAKHAAPAEVQIDPAEADVVRRIFREYAAGRSMQVIVYAFNHEGVPFPGKDTKRGPARRGWALASVHTILHNEKYIGEWTWNKTRFLKDPDSGRRRAVARPPSEWIRQSRPELQIVDGNLWTAVQGRFAAMGARFGTGRVPGAGAHVAYSPYLLSGLLRCGMCGARMQAARYTRRKGGRAYTYVWYACGFARAKGPDVCSHRKLYRRDWLEGAILERFRQATTPPMIAALTRAVNVNLAAAAQRRDARGDHLKAEILRLEGEAGHLVRYLRQGAESSTVRAELEATESALRGLRLELAEVDRGAATLPSVSLAWVRARLERLGDVLAGDPVRAREEMAKHLDGDPVITPLPPDPTAQLRVEISGHLKANGLLDGNQEAEALACGSLVAGARSERSAIISFAYRSGVF